MTTFSVYLLLLAIFNTFQYTISSNYLDYLFGLNYWNSNVLFLVLIISLYTRINFKILQLYLFKTLLSYSVLNLLIEKKKLIETLHIGTIVIHPILFYFCLVFLTIKVLRLLSWQSLNLFQLTYSRLNHYLTFTLILGGFWGFQSTVWGYFWVNDMVEWLLLMCIIYSLVHFHKPIHSKKILQPVQVLFILLNFILIVRLNLIPTRHSFIQNTDLVLWVLWCYLVSFLTAWQSSTIHALSILKLTKLTSFLLLNSKLLWCKLWLILYSVFYAATGTPNFFKKKLSIHFFIFLFFLLWNIYFSYFFILYELDYLLNSDLSVFKEQITTQFKQFNLRGGVYRDLEGVTFTLVDRSVRTFSLLWGLGCSVLLNNFLLVFLLVLFFFL